MQEIEPLEQVKISGGEHQPTYRDRIGDPAFPRRAIGVFSFTGLDIRAVDLEAPLIAFRRYRRARVPQVAGDALSESGSSANARQTNAVTLRRPRRHLPTPRLATHAPDGTRRHFAARANTLVVAFARRRSPARTRRGPPLICREIVSCGPSVRALRRPPTTR